MQGSFEKKVKEKLDEMRLQPTAPVWEKIESRIQPEKERRKGVFWLFFLLALLIATGWWLVVPSSSNKTNTITQAKPAVEKNPENRKQEALPTKESSKEEAGKPVRQEASISKEKTLLNDIVFQRANRGSELRHRAFKGNRSASTSNEPEREIENVTIAPSQKNLTNKTEQANAVEQQSLITAQTTTADSVGQNIKEEPKAEVSPLVADSAKIKIAAKRKWSNKVLFAAGWSSSVSSGAVNNSYSSPSSVTNGGVSNRIDRGPAEMTKGFSVSLGYAKEKEVTKRLSLSVGLQYAYYNTHQDVGMFKPLDTAVRFRNDAVSIPGYYSFSSSTANLSPTSYTNHYHVIELPVGLQWSIWKDAPLWLFTSVSYGRLLSTNALTFDAASGVYYANKKNNRENLLNGALSLQYAVIKSKGWRLSAGPVVQYNFLSSQKTSDNQHLVFAGLKTAVEF